MKSSQLMYFTMFSSLLASTPSDLSSQLHRERGPSCFELKFLAHSFLASMKGFDYNRVNSKVLANSVQNPARLEWRFQTRTTSKMPTPRPWPPKLGERGGGGARGAERRCLLRVARVTSSRRRGRLRENPRHSALGRLGQFSALGVIDLFALCDALGLDWKEKVRMGPDFPATVSPLGLLSGCRQEAVSSGDMCEGEVRRHLGLSAHRFA